MPGAYGFQYPASLKIDRSEGNLLQHARCEGIADTIVQLFTPLASGLIAIVHAPCLGFANFIGEENIPCLNL